jgi:hypothetical protein
VDVEAKVKRDSGIIWTLTSIRGFGLSIGSMTNAFSNSYRDPENHANKVGKILEMTAMDC